jgi:hypothetical protein
MRRRRVLAIATLTMAVVTVAPPVAHATPATNRYAEPGATGTTCSQADPCGIVTAINQAPAGSVIHLAGGIYGSPTPISTGLTDNDHALTIAGNPRGGVPRLQSSAQTALLLGGASSVSWLTIEAQGSTGLQLVNEKASADHMNVAVGATAGAAACRIEGTLSDSACFSNASDGSAIEDESMANFPVTEHATLVGDTAIAVGDGNAYGLAYTAYTDVTFDVTVINSILSGTSHDVFARNPDSTGTVAIGLSYSDYNSVVRTKQRATVTKLGTAHNITAAPKLADAELDELTEESDSPTVDAGKAFGNSAKDLDLDDYPRFINTAPDIGAYELAVAPSLASFAVVRRLPHAVTATISVNPHGMPTNLALIAVPMSGPSMQSKALELPLIRTAKTETLTVNGLTTGTPYALHAYANGQGGQTSSSTIDVTPPKPFTGVTIATHKASLTKHHVTVDLACPASAASACGGTLTLKRKGHGTAGTGAFDMPTNDTTAVKISLDHGTRKAIAKHGHVKLKAVADGLDGNQQRKKTHRTITVKA